MQRADFLARTGQRPRQIGNGYRFEPEGAIYELSSSGAEVQAEDEHRIAASEIVSAA
jgi:hypothetical protein